MKICLDLDGTLLEEKPTFQRSLAKPLPGAVESVNKLYNDGHQITIFSARSWSELEMTEATLNQYGFKYHYLLLGKVGYDVFVDDRAIRFKGDWKKVLNKLNKLRK
jgi:hydroxymethylpyrimidine pyrophosphatase-like HAD family hydrolase